MAVMRNQYRDPAIERIGPVLLTGAAALAAFALAVPLVLTVLSKFLF
jgi:hypothetical protein